MDFSRDDVRIVCVLTHETVSVRLAIYCRLICKYVWRLDEMMMMLEDLCYTGDQLCFRGSFIRFYCIGLCEVYFAFRKVEFLLL